MQNSNLLNEDACPLVFLFSTLPFNLSDELDMQENAITGFYWIRCDHKRLTSDAKCWIEIFIHDPLSTFDIHLLLYKNVFMNHGNDDDASANIDTKQFEWSLPYNKIF